MRVFLKNNLKITDSRAERSCLGIMGESGEVHKERILPTIPSATLTSDKMVITESNIRLNKSLV